MELLRKSTSGTTIVQSTMNMIVDAVADVEISPSFTAYAIAVTDDTAAAPGQPTTSISIA